MKKLSFKAFAESFCNSLEEIVKVFGQFAILLFAGIALVAIAMHGPALLSLIVTYWIQHPIGLFCIVGITALFYFSLKYWLKSSR
jgi:hypothetical protein